MPYIHELSDWPEFRFDHQRLKELIDQVELEKLILYTELRTLGVSQILKSQAKGMSDEIAESSAIEGEILPPASIRSSVARRLNLPHESSNVNQKTEATANLIFDAIQSNNKPLTPQRLIEWHSTLFAYYDDSFHPIVIGAFRPLDSQPMQVLSGPLHRPKVHFEAVHPNRIEKEISAFTQAFENPKHHPLIHAFIAHLWFLTIHPFDDGNGRIARAILDLAFARIDQQTLLPYSMSSAIKARREQYYKILEQTQRGDLEVTPYLEWFLRQLSVAITNARAEIQTTIKLNQAWNSWSKVGLTNRQSLALNKLVENQKHSTTNREWVKLTKVSSDTALRDLTDLETKGVLRRTGAGRSLRYEIIPLHPE